jgi:D-arabinose 1-dehydrogenase-like Zn-dependent alcohol dehydrogenase
VKSYKVVKNGEPLEEQKIDIPSPSGEQVLIKTIACGVCHTDVHIHDGYFDLGNDVHIPASAPKLIESYSFSNELS